MFNENYTWMFLLIVTWVGEIFFPRSPNQNDCPLLNLIFLIASRVLVQTVVWALDMTWLGSKKPKQWVDLHHWQDEKGDLYNWGPNFMRLRSKGSPTENPGYPCGPLRAHIHLPFISASFTIKHTSQPSFFLPHSPWCAQKPNSKSFFTFLLKPL